MNKNNLLRVLPVVGALAAIAIMPVSAQTVGVTGSVGVNSSVSGVTVIATTSIKGNVSGTTKVDAAVTKADQAITARINALNALSARINAMVRVSATDKASLSSEIQNEITAMNTLEAQISTDESTDATTSLKTDIQSITKGYRIYALIVPQGAIEAMADRVMTLVTDFNTVATNLQTRITAAQSSGVDASAAVSALADMNAKTADANTQAQAAVSATATLQPDNGVQSVMQSNTAALKAARSDLQTAQQDLVAARKDAGTIVKWLESLKVNTSATSSAGVTASSS